MELFGIHQLVTGGGLHSACRGLVCLEGLEVGFYDAGRHDVIVYDDRVDACSDFILREVRVACSASFQGTRPDAVAAQHRRYDWLLGPYLDRVDQFPSTPRCPDCEQ